VFNVHVSLTMTIIHAITINYSTFLLYFCQAELVLHTHTQKNVTHVKILIFIAIFKLVGHTILTTLPCTLAHQHTHTHTHTHARAHLPVEKDKEPGTSRNSISAFLNPLLREINEACDACCKGEAHAADGSVIIQTGACYMIKIIAVS